MKPQEKEGKRRKRRKERQSQGDMWRRACWPLDEAHDPDRTNLKGEDAVTGRE